MAEEKERRLHIREFAIGTKHLVSTGNFENITVTAEIKFGVPVGISEEEIKAYIMEAQTRLQELAVETYANQHKTQIRLRAHQQKLQNRNQPIEPDELHEGED
jgi:hypothetical protein